MLKLHISCMVNGGVRFKFDQLLVIGLIIILGILLQIAIVLVLCAIASPSNLLNLAYLTSRRRLSALQTTLKCSIFKLFHTLTFSSLFLSRLSMQ